MLNVYEACKKKKHTETQLFGYTQSVFFKHPQPKTYIHTICLHVPVLHVCNAHRNRKRDVRTPGIKSYRWLHAALWMMGIESGSVLWKSLSIQVFLSAEPLLEPHSGILDYDVGEHIFPLLKV